jgi:hypothetical protein
VNRVSFVCPRCGMTRGSTPRSPAGMEQARQSRPSVVEVRPGRCQRCQLDYTAVALRRHPRHRVRRWWCYPCFAAFSKET